MTEQEKRENAIWEMAKRELGISAYYGQNKQEIDKMWEDTMSAGCLSTALPFMVCLYSRIAGYRKEEVVARETAKEISEFIENNYSYDLAKEIRKKFCGVEVDE